MVTPFLVSSSMSIGSMATLLRALLLLVLVVSVLAGEDYYRILGIKKNASDKEIKKACKLITLCQMKVRDWANNQF